MINHYLSMWWRALALLLAIACGCTTKANPRSCNDGICNDQAFPFCDVNGTYGGEPGECIAVECTPGEAIACEATVAVRCNMTGNNYEDVQCTGGCDVSAGGCIGCSTDAECGGLEPICEQTSHTCRGCRVDAECESTVCDVDTGACVSEMNISFASADGTGSAPCSRAQPCPLTRAISTSLAMATPSIVRMLPGRYDSLIDIRDSKRLTIVATGATLSTDQEPPIRVNGAADLSVRGLEVDVRYPAGFAVYCGFQDTVRSMLRLRDVNISSSTSTSSTITVHLCTLVASNLTLRAQTYGSLLDVNTDGELNLDRSKLLNASGSDSVRVFGFGNRRKIIVTNSLFERVALSMSGDEDTLTTTSTYNIAFNTFIDAQYVSCAATTRFNALLENNVYRWTGSDSTVQTSARCSFQNNMFFPAAGLGGSNRDVDPQLTNLATGDYRLKASSPAVDAAMPSSTLPATHDLLGVARPQGPQADIGAYEYVP